MPSFEQRHVNLIVVSNDDLTTTQQTQSDFPHLQLLADVDLSMASAWQVIHPGAALDGGDTNAPTTVLIDEQGQVKRVLRPTRFMSRYSPAELLAEFDEVFPP